MIENSDRVPPSVDDIAGWADQYGLSHPVLIDGGGSITSKFLNGDPNFWKLRSSINALVG